MKVIVCVLVLLVLGILFLKSRKYQKEYVEALDKKEHSLKILYPIGLWLILATPIGRLVQKKEDQREQIAALHIGEDQEELQILHWCKKLAVVYISLLAAAIINLASITGEEGVELLKEQRYLQKQGPEGDQQEVNLIVSAENKKDMEITVQVPNANYTEEELANKMQEAKNYVKEHFLGENEGSQISLPLKLINSVPGNAISIQWSIERSDLIDDTGQLHNGLLEQAQDCQLVANFIYGDSEDSLEFQVTVLPAKEMTQGEWEEAVNEAVENATESNSEAEVLELPDTVWGERVSYKEPEKEKSLTILLGGIAIAIVLWIAGEQDLKKKNDQREKQMLLDYPELINKFTLLISAGMTIHGAWEKIAGEYEKKLENKKTKRRYAYDEWCLTYSEMCNGVTEMEALERFGARIKLMPYLRFSTLLSQNLRKGSKGLIELLEYEAMDAYEKRKQNTKKLAEEAGTKLLVPMILMLILVVLIIMAPAIMSI